MVLRRKFFVVAPLEDKIRKNPFISDTDMDAILQEECPEVKLSLVQEIKSQIAFSSVQFVALVDEIENQLSKTKMELKRTLRVERAEGNDWAEAINQSLSDFATTELGQVFEMLLNGTRSNMEEDLQTLKALVDSKFEVEWTYEPCAKKESIKSKILTKLDDQIENSRQKVLKKMKDDETKLVLGCMNSILSSFAKLAIEILDAGKHISLDRLEGILKEEMEQKLDEFQLLLQLNKVEHAKHMGKMTQKLKDKKGGILQTNTENLEKIVTVAEGVIRTHYEQSGPLNSRSLEQLVQNTQSAVTEYLAENCDGECDEMLRAHVTQIITEAHKSWTQRLEGEGDAMRGTVSEDAVTCSENERACGARQKDPNVNSEENPFVKPFQDPSAMFQDLPISTVAIHMGLRHTRIGLFRPGTKEFVNLGLVEHKLYYRDDTVLVAYDEITQQKLGEPDLDFGGLIMRGRIDELVDVNLGGRTQRVRKEEIFSSFFAALKRKSEIETMMKLRDCVIVVPQFLNKAQRKCIGDAGKIAGFHDVKLIDDTAATVLDYIMLNKISGGPVIAISALEGPVDVARFMTVSGVPTWNEISGSHFMKSEPRGRGFLATALWPFASWETTEEGGEIWKMFNFMMWEMGHSKVNCNIKVFVGGEDIFIKVKAALPQAESKSFIRTSELSPLRGGAYMAAICNWNMSCPIFSDWNSLSVDERWKPSHEEFEKKLLSMGFKESMRVSNFPIEKTVYLSKEDIAKITNRLKDGAQVHDEAMKAVRVLRAIKEAGERQQIRNRTDMNVLTSLISVHLSDLKQPNLRMEEAKRIRDDLVGTWCQYVQGHGTPASSQK